MRLRLVAASAPREAFVTALLAFYGGMVAPGANAQDRARPPGLGFTRDFERVHPQGYVYSLAQFDDGNGPQLYAGGDIEQVTGQLQFMSLGVVRWDGSTWSRVSWGVYLETIVGTSVPGVHCMQEFDDGNGKKLYLGGEFDRFWSSQSTSYEACSGVVTWSGAQLERAAQLQSVAAVPHDMIVFDDGTGEALYLAGINGGHMGRYSSRGVESVGGFMVPNAPIAPVNSKLAVHDDGTGPKLYVAGNFERVFEPGSTTEFVPANGLAAWDGVRWTPILGPWDPQWGTLGAQLGHFGRMVSYDDGHGPALYMAAVSLLRYRNSSWEEVLPPPINIGPYVVHGVYDDGNGPALYVTGKGIPVPGVPPGQYVQIAKYDHDGWHPLGQVSTSLQSNEPANCVATIDLGEGPDLFVGFSSGGQSAGGQSPISIARYRGVHRDVAPVCGGDGSLADCPCGERGIVGRGCPNSAQSRGALLSATGRPEDDSLSLSAQYLPANAATLLLQGDGYDFTPRFVGNGVLCTSGTIARLALHTADAGNARFPGPGEPTLRAMAAAHGDLMPPGSVRYYQAWYRDAGSGFCGGGASVNVTNGMRVVW